MAKMVEIQCNEAFEQTVEKIKQMKKEDRMKLASESGIMNVLSAFNKARVNGNRMNQNLVEACEKMGLDVSWGKKKSSDFGYDMITVLAKQNRDDSEALLRAAREMTITSGKIIDYIMAVERGNYNGKKENSNYYQIMIRHLAVCYRDFLIMMESLGITTEINSRTYTSLQKMYKKIMEKHERTGSM